MKRILVMGAAGPAGINFIESLGLADEQMYVIGADANRFHIEWLNTGRVVLSPLAGDSGYDEFLLSLVEREGIEFAHAQPDIEVRALSCLRSELRRLGCSVFLPEERTLDVCQDKLKSAVIWSESGMPSAGYLAIDSEQDLHEAADRLGLPFWLRATVGDSSRGSTPVESIDTARHWLDYWKAREVSWKWIAQEYLPGRNIAFQSLWREGELIVSQARERIEYIYPRLAPSGVTNTPVVAKTIHDEAVNRAASMAVRSIDAKANGVYCVDLKESAGSEIIPTEINAGRFFTTSMFFSMAGCNMPYQYVKMGFGEEPDRMPEYNAVEPDLYWIRHIDCPAVLVKETDLRWRRLTVE